MAAAARPGQRRRFASGRSRCSSSPARCRAQARNWQAYLQVYADAVVDDDPDLVVDVMMAVGGRMSGQPLGEDVREFAAMAKEEGRVVLRCRPYETFSQPPRHLHRNDQEEQITRWISGRVPWEAPDPT